jgi:chromate transporter
VKGLTTAESDRSKGPATRAGPASEVFRAFLKLGLTSFGGPIAHLGYFHRELIERRRWVDEATFAQLLALCQLLPGPASSQLGFSLGLIRAGWLGALAAFIAFTLPSTVLLVCFAHALPLLDQPYGRAAIHGLKLVAVVVVAQGVFAMARRLTPDLRRALIAVAAGAFLLVSNSPIAQLAVVGAGAVLGLLLCRPTSVEPSSQVTRLSLALPYGPRMGLILIALFAVLLAAAIVIGPTNASLAAIAAAFYRAGALVFGGGHVVLPLLQQAVVAPGWVSMNDFLAGYGAAQAIPGPLFTIAAFLGARLEGPHGGVLGASVALLAILLPGFLLVAGALPFWSRIVGHARTLNALAGVNAAVVGLLAAALYNPIWISAVLAPADIAVVLVGFAVLASTRVSVLVIIAWCVLTSILRTLAATN